MKKLVLILMAITMIGALGAATVHADSFYCTVNATGTGGGNTYVMLTDAAATPAFTSTWFFASAGQANQILATALTALSNGSRVQAIFPGTGTPAAFSTINNFYLRP